MVKDGVMNIKEVVMIKDGGVDEYHRLNRCRTSRAGICEKFLPPTFGKVLDDDDECK